MPLHGTFKQPQIAIWEKQEIKAHVLVLEQNIGVNANPYSLHVSTTGPRLNLSAGKRVREEKLRRRDQGACSGVCCCLQRCWAKN
jgi:hypothetical protein